MDIEVVEYKRVVVVSVRGRIDGATSGEFESTIHAEMQKGKNNIILDMSEVEFISSAGLRVLVTKRKAVKSAGGDIVMAGPSQQVIDTMDIAGLDILFRQFDDRESAVASF